MLLLLEMREFALISTTGMGLTGDWVLRGFFGLIVALIVPPSMPMQMYIFVRVQLYLDKLEAS